MASNVLASIIGNCFTVTFELLSVLSVNSVEVSDDNSLDVRERLLAELYRLQSIMTSRKLKEAYQSLISAIQAFTSGIGVNTDGTNISEETDSHFANVEATSAKVIAGTSSLDDKVMATKLQLMCVLFRHNYYVNGDMEFEVRSALTDMDSFVQECHEKLLKLARCSEVQSSMSYYENKSIFNLPGAKAANFNVLAELSHIKVYVEKYSGQVCPLTGPSGKPFSLLEQVDRRIRAGHKDPVTDVAVRAGRLYTCSEDATVKVFDTKTLAEVATLQVPYRDETEEGLVCLAVSDDRLYVGTDKNLIRVWSLKTLAFEGNLVGHGGVVNCLLVHDDKLLSGSSDQTIKIWNTLCLSEITSLDGHTNAIQALALHGDKLFSGSWDASIKVWDMTDFVEVATLSGHTLPVRALAVSGNRLYSGSRDKTIRVWDIPSLTAVATLEGHREWVGALAVCGNKLYSGSDDRTVKVWDTVHLSEVVTIHGHTHWVRAVAVSGGTLYSGSGDCTVHIRLIG